MAGATALSAAATSSGDRATASGSKKARAKGRCKAHFKRSTRRLARGAAKKRSAKKRLARRRARRCLRSRAAATTVGVTITSAPSGSTSETSATFGWSIGGRVNQVSCKLDGGSFVACSSPKAYSGLAAGSHTFVVRVSKGSSTASDSATWTVTGSTSTPPPPPAAACSDGIDNDGDAKVDYPADPGCSGASDTDETDPPSASNLLFADEFGGAAGAPADSARWMLRGNVCDGNLNYTCAKDSNVFQDGLGNLVVRTKREPSNYLGGGPFSGGWVETFAYGTGWPPSPIKAAWQVPYHIEMRAKFPHVAGAWGGGWNMNVDRPTSENIYELDWSEERMTFPASADCHQHTWLGGRDAQAWDCSPVNVSDMGQNWHVFSADVYTDRVVYKVDGLTRGTAYGVSGRHGLIVNMGIAGPGSWGSGGGQPAASDPGPWDLLVDYVRVSGL